LNSASRAWIGADPGGAGCFGICLLYADGSVTTANVDCADDAVTFVRGRLQNTPDGAAVDAPLWWSSGRSGDRCADRWLRERYGLTGGEVQAANSLRGAALVQGVMFVTRMREHYPDLPVTESHPKALLKVCYGGNWNRFARRFGVRWDAVGEHARDAIVAAVAAREGFGGRWPNDLSERRLAGEQDPKSYWLAPINYFWPEC
jgi:predicted nuclease with RNAse H fold